MVELSTLFGRRLLLIDTPHITDTPARVTAVIHLTIPRGEIQNVSAADPIAYRTELNRPLLGARPGQ
jgi:hypothetical protein